MLLKKVNNIPQKTIGIKFQDPKFCSRKSFWIETALFKALVLTLYITN